MQQTDLLKSIFGDQPHDKLQDASRDFPYYSTAQYFQLRSADPADNDAYNRIASRVGLHFNNPFYLGFILQNDHIGAEGTFALTEETKQSPQPEVVTSDKAEELVFEPLYTTDYFASQGIKISEEVKADDKLGKQLRSFTDWLKTMKKLHDQKLPAGSEQMDATVQHIAEKSNSDAEVITESMAEVFQSQGKTGRALEVYRKLSLLNPAKSAYFAAKIESLKDN